ncbi:MAG: nucleotidyltransferase family protein [Chloroflexi bacterium]|nr:nucleotidyltransferase family protein [Chloroflexota bacterium]
MISASELEKLGPSDWQALLRLATDQRVRPLLHHRLRERGLIAAVPTNIREDLSGSYRRNTLRILHMSAEFRQIAIALQAEGIAVIVLKGLYLASSVYESIGLREMNDIDLMVRRQSVAPAAEILTHLGYRPHRPYVLESDLAWSHHLTGHVKPGGTAVELHWHITRPGQSYSIDLEELWERAQHVRIAGVDVLALCPEDMVLHICLHTSYQHRFEFGLRPSCDLATVLHHFQDDLDWDAIEERTVRWGWQRGVTLALYLAQEWVGAALPEDWLTNLQPQGLDTTILATARDLVFTPRRATRELSANVALLIERSSSLKHIFRHLVRMIFPSASLMSKAYGVSPGSFRLYLYYPRRWWELVQRNRADLLGLFRHDKTLTSVAEHKNILARWLETESRVLIIK